MLETERALLLCLTAIPESRDVSDEDEDKELGERFKELAFGGDMVIS